MGGGCWVVTGNILELLENVKQKWKKKLRGRFITSHISHPCSQTSKWVGGKKKKKKVVQPGLLSYYDGTQNKTYLRLMWTHISFDLLAQLCMGKEHCFFFNGIFRFVLERTFVWCMFPWVHVSFSKSRPLIFEHFPSMQTVNISSSLGQSCNICSDK